MKNIIKMILIGIETAVLFVVVGGLTSAITKTIYSNILIENFKSKAIFDEEASSDMLKVYVVPSNEERPTIEKVGKDYYPGNTGDILITLQSELTIPFIHEFVSFFAGGHAALVLGDYEDLLDKTTSMNTVESSGLNDDLNLADTYSKTYFADYQHPVIGLRVSLSLEERVKVLTRGLSLAGDPYNYSFLFDTDNKSYCSDLVAKAFNSVGVNLNKDGFTTSIYDLLISGETYMTYYRYFDNDGVEYVYYLDSK
ncbi:MAG: hypothetical protein NC310_01470 [Roseburia sp.]|nr:hypothetical protein [Anaeroplasma bactoclasticum]MCM1195723.1 hypothetical protein [Roseburia sp.]MCM1556073.1 hypothetical protein [Anaeroplasma bactoclasticum]